MRVKRQAALCNYLILNWVLQVIFIFNKITVVIDKILWLPVISHSLIWPPQISQFSDEDTEAPIEEAAFPQPPG